MITATRPAPTAAMPTLSNWVPVEIAENDGAGNAWVKLSDRWSKIHSIENLWELDGEWQQGQPVIRLHFKVVVEGHQSIALYKDLVEGAWYRRVALCD